MFKENYMGLFSALKNFDNNKSLKKLEKIANLVHANNTIIENINQLSDSSASVSESAKEVEVQRLQTRSHPNARR